MHPETRPPRTRRIVCYAVNGAGLGHLSRLIHLARWIRRLAAFIDGRAPEILFLTSSEATRLLSDADFAAFKLPSKGTARKCHIDVPEYRRLARQFTWQVLSDFAPDLLVVDTFAQGTFDELFPILDGPFARALVLRRIKTTEARRPIFQAACRFYDVIVMPHEESEVTELMEVLPVGPRRILTGPVHGGAPASASQRAALRRELGLPDTTPLIYLSAGGGGDPHAENLLHDLVRTVAEHRPDATLLVGAGPLYRGRRIFAPVAGGRRADVIWHTEPGIARLFPACDAAISAAGYNSFNELLATGVPSAFFGLEKIADDQDERIRALAARGACLRLSLPLDPTAITAAVDALVSRGDALRAAAQAAVPPSAAARGAAALLAPLYGDRPAELLPLFTPALIAALDGLGAAALPFTATILPRLLGPTATPEPAARAWVTELLPTLTDATRAELSQALERPPAGLSALVDAVAACLADPATQADPEATLQVFDHALRRTGARDESPTPGAIDAIRQFIAGLGDFSPSLSASEVLSLFKALPRLGDATLVASLAAFRHFVRDGLARGENLPELTRRLQLLKMQGPNVPISRLQRIFDLIL